MMRRSFEENKREDREECQKYRDFFLELGILLTNNNFVFKPATYVLAYALNLNLYFSIMLTTAFFC